MRASLVGVTLEGLYRRTERSEEPVRICSFEGHQQYPVVWWVQQGRRPGEGVTDVLAETGAVADTVDRPCQIDNQSRDRRWARPGSQDEPPWPVSLVDWRFGKIIKSCRGFVLRKFAKTRHRTFRDKRYLSDTQPAASLSRRQVYKKGAWVEPLLTGRHEKWSWMFWSSPPVAPHSHYAATNPVDCSGGG